MRRRTSMALAAGLVSGLLFAACVEHREVHITFGTDGEGLTGFLCVDPSDPNGKRMVLDRLDPDAGSRAPDAGPTVAKASLVTDFIQLGGLPGCRVSQLIEWCKSHDCKPIDSTRRCTEIELPTDVTGLARADVQKLVAAQMASLSGDQVISQAPDGFVMLRVIATAQPCDQLAPNSTGVLPAYEQTALVGCAYSCATSFNEIDQDVYLGFDTLDSQCEEGLRTCSDHELHWQP